MNHQHSVFQLIKIEIDKFKKNAVISLLAILYVFTLPTILFIAKEFKNLPPPLHDNFTFFTFPLVWDYLGYTGNWLSFFFLGLIAVFMVVNEVSYKTFRQNIITGLTRRTYFMAKLYSIIIISFIDAIYYGIVAIIIGMLHTDTSEWSMVTENSWAIPRFFLMTLGYMSFGIFVGFIIRRSGISVLFYLIYILMFEAILKWAVHFRIFPNQTINYYPSNSFEDLMPFPLYRFADMIPKKEINFQFLLSYTEASLSSICWIIIFLSIAYWTVQKRDV